VCFNLFNNVKVIKLYDTTKFIFILGKSNFPQNFFHPGTRDIIQQLHNNIRMIVKRLQSRTKKIPTISDKDCFKSGGTFID